MAQTLPPPPARSAAAAEAARKQHEQTASGRPTTTQTQRKAPELQAAPLIMEPLEQERPARSVARARYESPEAQLTRMQLAQPRAHIGSYGGAPPLTLNTGLMLVLICLASLLVLFTMGGSRGSSFSGWNPLQRVGEVVGEAMGQSSSSLVAAVRPAGDAALKGPPSITPDQIERILDAYQSPAVGTGEVFYNLGLKYGIDPAYAVAFFIHESSAGTNPRWDGMKLFDANDPRRSVTTHNIGNISCAGYPTCLGRWRDYPDWASGIEDWYKLIDVEYIQGRGHQTVADVIPVYAPSFENDVQRYVDAVNGLVEQWRTVGVP